MFSQTTEYALRAMAWLALTPDELVSTLALAGKTKVPPHYLAKVLQQLSAANLIVGRRGVRGGYKLSRAPRDISLLQVVRAVAQIDRITSCPLDIPTHSHALCSLHRRTDAAAKAVMDIYGGCSLQDLLDEPGVPTPLCAVDLGAKISVSAPHATRPE